METTRNKLKNGQGFPQIAKIHFEKYFSGFYHTIYKIIRMFFFLKTLSRQS
jgi:hypothetical protein